MHDHPGMKITALSIRHIDARSDVCEPRAYGEASVLRGRLRGARSENVQRDRMSESAIVPLVLLPEVELP
jgi:hypothetical protein